MHTYPSKSGYKCTKIYQVSNFYSKLVLKNKIFERLLPFVPALLDVDVSDAGAGDGFMVNAGL